MCVNPRPADPAFTAASTRLLLRRACLEVGLDSSEAELIRLGENAIYVLPSSVVVRIARSADHWSDAVKEISVSRWLSESGLRAAKALDTNAPIDIDGHPATFWEFIDGRSGEPTDVRNLAVLLRRLHRLGEPTSFSLPVDDPLDRVERRINHARTPSKDQDTLTAKFEMLARELTRLSYPLPPSVVHGDAHVENLMVDAEGPILIDLERMAWGHPEWDLAVTATEYVSAGFWTAEQYAAFVDSYGYDVTEWDGFDLLRQTHELKMTSWLMQNVNESDAIREEYELRMEAIRDGRSSRPWTPF